MAVVKSARLLLYNSMDSGSFFESAVAEDADNALRKGEGEKNPQNEQNKQQGSGDLKLQVPIDVGLTMHFHGREEHLNWKCRTATLC